MRSEAQKRADKKYYDKYKNTHKKHTTIGIGVEKAKAEEIYSEAHRQNLSVSRYVLSAVLYCMQNNICFSDKEQEKGE